MTPTEFPHKLSIPVLIPTIPLETMDAPLLEKARVGEAPDNGVPVTVTLAAVNQEVSLLLSRVSADHYHWVLQLYRDNSAFGKDLNADTDGEFPLDYSQELMAALSGVFALFGTVTLEMITDDQKSIIGFEVKVAGTPTDQIE